MTLRLAEQPFIELERLTITTPLGLRFWDVGASTVVGTGLRVTVYPPDNPQLRVAGFANRSGFYLVRDLPGLRAAENGVGGERFWANLPVRRMFTVEVVDDERRFLPFAFNAVLPVKGLLRVRDCVPLSTTSVGPPHSPPTSFPPVDSSPEPELFGIPLFSAPARRASSDLAVLHAELWDETRDEPAAWARLEARLADQPAGQPAFRPARGVADEKGRVVLIFPYPAPFQDSASLSLSTPASPLATGAPQSLSQQRWTLTLRAFYAPLQAPGAAAPTIPDLCRVLEQPAAEFIIPTTGSRPMLDGTLEYGRELIVKTPSRSTLLIRATGSPP